ncbi:PREDICTED: palmitoyl-monogalactosyldiacylglycerol delta-7 desaturase, chloroplastic-like [Fragaria vesca subsp. vesca]|uniref:palmitoyl-monogalactosyldiacylglycerol delta-7 desaturase, chloroplastic-like n=1 Tax=Fragaria vesca subsp. vesca TaxID=101020 RepID=UPI0002C36E2D|nr:PREDICTED: palmitoyl-monogalactosyldiacylglycerol delta-7 desaturase, chloroplastic-like [Fragaria vesca subsp. vesca]
MVSWRMTRVVLGRECHFIDVVTWITVILLHCLALMAPFQFTWGAFWVFLALYFLTGLGISLGYHRNLAHRSLKLPKWLEYFFAYCGVVTLQGSPVDWVSTHRYHHQFTDTKKDPHSPILGLWFSHIGWIFNYRLRFQSHERRLKNADDLRRQAYYKFLHRTYLLHPVALGVLLYALGGLPFLVWGTGVRTVVGYHITFSVNSICHTWGKRVWDTGDLSRNNWLLALPTLGEGWHHNHHSFDFSARLGLEWWQIDLTWYFIRFLQVFGLATDVKTPTEAQKKRKPLYNETTEQKFE